MPQWCDRCNCVFFPTTSAVHCPTCNTSSRLPEALPLTPLPILSIQSNFIQFDILEDNEYFHSLIEVVDDLFRFIEGDEDLFRFIEGDQDFDTTVDWTAAHYEPRPTPAATSFINSLNAHKVTVTGPVLKQDLNTESSCVICSDEFLLKESVNKMPCGHWFHSECIVKWINLKNTCPLCRYEFPGPGSTVTIIAGESTLFRDNGEFFSRD